MHHELYCSGQMVAANLAAASMLFTCETSAANMYIVLCCAIIMLMSCKACNVITTKNSS